MSKTKRSYSYKPVVVDWNGLKAIGWPFCRTETIDEERRARGGYPKFYKLGKRHGNEFRVEAAW